MGKKSSVSILCFILITLSPIFVSAQTCDEAAGTFKPNSTYEKNRLLINSTLASNVTAHAGYFNGSIGLGPDRVYALGMCAPGAEPQSCSDCIQDASVSLLSTCLNQTDGFVWSGDDFLCLVRYSSKSLDGVLALEPITPFHNVMGIRKENQEEFDSVWDGLKLRMITRVSSSVRNNSSTSLSLSGKYYAKDVAPVPVYGNILMLMQCTPDISSNDCSLCLKSSVDYYKNLYHGKKGVIMLRPSCFFRWELYNFSGAFDHINDPPPLSNSPSTIEAATSNFSELNKLGAGGFGEVYKVWRLWENKSLPDLIDPGIKDYCKIDEVVRYIHIGLLCVQENPADRPTMSTIHQMLTTSSITLPVPLPPGFFFGNRPGMTTLSQGLDPSQSSSKSYTCSVDEATITDRLSMLLLICRYEHVSTALVLFPILLSVLVTLSFISVSGQICRNTGGTFRPNTTYDSNRRLILSSLASNVTARGGFFYNSSFGQDPDRVYAMASCIPGAESKECSDCITEAVTKMIQNCPNQTEAFSWPGTKTLCMVRYANSSFYGSMDLEPNSLRYNTGNITINMSEFERIWDAFMIRMIDSASSGRSGASSSSSGKYYAADITSLTTFQRVYALMECTPDLSPGNCEACLRANVRRYQDCCRGNQGGVARRPSCFFRWDLYPFLGAFDNIISGAPPLQPLTGDGDGAAKKDGDSLSVGAIVGIVVASVIAIVLVLLALAFAFYRRRKSSREVDFQTGYDISNTDSLQFDFKTIEAATDKFSRSNMLGQGGFGEVFKAWRLWSNGSPLELVDPFVRKSCDSSEVARCIHIALLCVQENPMDRPTLSTIILMLTSNTITLPVPHQPGFFFKTTRDQDLSAEDLESGQSTGKFVAFSINDGTICDLNPR
ncbi:hypothetical protein Bca4012_080189 [Brassica carinata]